MLVQRLEAHGTLPWGASALHLGDVGEFTDSRFGPALAPDGSGGAVGDWIMDPYFFGQRVSSSGAIVWPRTFLNEGPLLMQNNYAFEAWWTSQDGVGGFVTTWLDGRVPSPYTWGAQHFDINGVVSWGANGMDLGIPAYTQFASFVSDGAGGLIAFWSAPGLSGDYDLYAQRYGSNGLPLWTAGGVPVCSQPGDQGKAWAGVAAVSDGAGGACVAWTDTRNDPSGDVYAQRVDGSGALQWASSGVPLCTVLGADSMLVAVPDGTGGLIAMWEDYRLGIDLYAQRIGGDGVTRWTADGALVCGAGGAQTLSVPHGAPSCLAADGAGGIFAAWADTRPGFQSPSDIYAQHLDGMGTPIWPRDGLRFGSPGTNASIVPDGAGGCAVLWSRGTDLRARGSSGVVTGVAASGMSRFLVRAVRPNPARGPFRLDFSLAERGPVRLEVFDVAGRRVAGREEPELRPGNHTLTVGALAPGLYSVRLRQGEHSAIARAIVVR